MRPESADIPRKYSRPVDYDARRDGTRSHGAKAKTQARKAQRRAKRSK